jgi:hypothetical protein
MLLEGALEAGLDLIFELRGRVALYRTSDGNETPVRAVKGNPQASITDRAFSGGPSAMREAHAVALLVSELERDPANGDQLTFQDTGEAFTVRAPASRTSDGKAWWPVRLVPV